MPLKKYHNVLCVFEKVQQSSMPLLQLFGALHAEVKTVRIFFGRIRGRIRLEGIRYVRIRVRIFNIRYRIRIRIFKSHIYDVDIQSYHIRHG